ncbi:MAG TPA: metalloregulator ArsR/SmtB family transcription factor [Armatimonadota bacterium]|nr:metalloregulator ArsR/SmtB family transcription factor [Armatimonadota bacterium]
MAVETYPRTDLTRGALAKRTLSRADEVESLAQRLSALSDGSRLKILLLLHTCGEMCVCELQDILGLTRPNFSFHLQALRYAGFVTSRKEGKWVFYRIVREQLRTVARVLGALFEDEPEKSGRSPRGEQVICREDETDDV